jgi:PAS domain S-box-containing protein
VVTQKQSGVGEGLQDFDHVRLEQTRRATIASPGPSVFYDHHGVCRAASPAWEAISGWPAGSCVGKRFDELIPGVSATARSFHSRVTAGVALMNEQEEMLVAADGRVSWVQCEYRPIASFDGGMLGYVVHGRDVTALVAARREAQLGAERLKMALEAARAGVFEIDYDARSFWCSPEFEALIGRPMSFEEACASSWPMIHTEDVERVRELVDAGPTPAASAEALETRIRLPNGAVRWIQVQIKLTRRPDGSTAKLTGLVVDIDARKRQELAMSWMRREAHENSERLSLALESAHAGVFETDFTNRTFWCSPELTEIMGQTPTWADASQKVWPMIHPDDHEAMLRTVENALVTLKIEPLETRVVRPDGEVRWVDLRSVIHKDSSGALTKVVGVLIDIDARKRQELALIDARQDAQKNADRLKAALNAGQAGVFETNFLTRSFWCSPEMVRILERQLTFEEAAGVWPIIHPDDVPRVQAAIDQSQGAQEEARCEWRVRLPSGQYRWVEARAQPIYTDDGAFERLVGVILDIDARKRQELALAEAQHAAEAAAEAKSRFLANMSHEIRTPMNGVMGVLHLLDKEPLSGDGRSLLGEAQACGQMLAQLLNDVIDFSKIEAGRLELAPEPVDPARLLESVTGMLRPQAEAKGLRISTEIQGERGWIMADPVRLRQALFNLIGNAVKFTSEGRVDARLVLRPGAPGQTHLRFEIEDTGVGIAQDAQPHLFQRFHQADGSTARQFGGSGLGLAITRNLARLMGGEVGFTSREGQGSVFWLDVPAPVAEPPANEEDSDFAPSAAPLRGLRILVVEDNPTNRLVAGKILEGLGAEVASAADGALGVEAVSSDRYDLVLMDIQMPHMDGVEATRRIRSLGGEPASTPIIGLTANAMAHQRASYLDAGMDGVAAKPISPADLVTEIARVLNAGRGKAAAPSAKRRRRTLH